MPIERTILSLLLSYCCLTRSGDAIEITEPVQAGDESSKTALWFPLTIVVLFGLGCGPEKKNKKLLMKIKETDLPFNSSFFFLSLSQWSA